MYLGTLFEHMIGFAKAFHRIDHNIILRKLQDLEVHPLLFNWIVDFLLAGCFSDYPSKPAGVKQGTKLGPRLFIVTINDFATIPTRNTDPINILC